MKRIPIIGLILLFLSVLAFGAPTGAQAFMSPIWTPSESGNFLGGVTSLPGAVFGMGNGNGSFGNSYAGSYPAYSGNYGNAYAASPFNALPDVTGQVFALPNSVLSFGLG